MGRKASDQMGDVPLLANFIAPCSVVVWTVACGAVI